MNIEMLQGWEGRQMFWGDLSARAGREPVQESYDRWQWGSRQKGGTQRVKRGE